MFAQSDDFKRKPCPLEVGPQLVQPLHHTVIHEFRAFQIHDHVVLLLESKLAELPPKGDPVRKHSGASRINLNRGVIDHLHLEKGLEHASDRQPIQKVNDQFHCDTNEHTDQEIGRQHAHERGREDGQLLTANFVDADEFIRGGEPATGVDEHRRQRRQWNRTNQSWQEGDERKQEDAVPEIGKSRMRAVVDIGLATHDLRDHRQAAN